MNKIPPRLLTLSAIGVGFILIDDLDSCDLYALGNWLMLIAQVLCTNASFKNNSNNFDFYKDFFDLDLLCKLRDAIDNEIFKMK